MEARKAATAAAAAVENLHAEWLAML